MKVTEVRGSGHRKIEESTHPQQYKNKGILYCVALESEKIIMTRFQLILPVDSQKPPNLLRS